MLTSGCSSIIGIFLDFTGSATLSVTVFLTSPITWSLLLLLVVSAILLGNFEAVAFLSSSTAAAIFVSATTFFGSTQHCWLLLVCCFLSIAARLYLWITWSSRATDADLLLVVYMTRRPQKAHYRWPSAIYFKCDWMWMNLIWKIHYEIIQFLHCDLFNVFMRNCMGKLGNIKIRNLFA